MAFDSMKRNLYPPIEPYDAVHLDVGDGHELYVEQSGNQQGKPVLFLHGGPGGGTGPIQRRFFDPSIYRIILLDQRGCGKSRPHASLDNNTTWHLVEDLEKVRQHLEIDRWIVFGGSWGSTLALLYAETYPARVNALVLRGIFLMRAKELDWFYGNETNAGTGAIFPEAWDNFINHLPQHERATPIKSYYARLTSNDEAVKLAAAQAWSVWETAVVTLVPDPAQLDQARGAYFALPFARIEAHFFANNGFLECDNQILRDAHKLKDIPTTIIQGRYDAICPPASAYELANAMPHADLRIISIAGHSAFEDDILSELVQTMDSLR